MMFPGRKFTQDRSSWIDSVILTSRYGCQSGAEITRQTSQGMGINKRKSTSRSSVADATFGRVACNYAAQRTSCLPTCTNAAPSDELYQEAVGNEVMRLRECAAAYRIFRKQRHIVHDCMAVVSHCTRCARGANAAIVATPNPCQLQTRFGHHRYAENLQGSNALMVTFTRERDLNGTVYGADGIGGLLARSHGYSSGSWSYHNFYHCEGNGNVTALVNSGGTLQASYIYDPYGRYLSGTGTLLTANVMRFSSKPWVSFLSSSTTSGLYYYGYRFYDPYLQRWLNRDPFSAWSVPEKYVFAILLARGPAARRWVSPTFEREPRNEYWFAANDPTGQVDTEGQWVLGVVAAAAAVYNFTLSGYEFYEFAKCMLQHYETQKMAARLDTGIPAAACTPIVDNLCWPLLGDALTHFASGASWGIGRVLLIRSGFNPINILKKIGGG